jgi:crotonobetainyl-CoA:carnitine CoA-transferase CaiB-like acyl-CoA transferase
VQKALEKHRVPFAPILTVEQAMNHPHLRERRTVRTIKDRFLGEFEIPGFPMRFSDYAELDLEAPTLVSRTRRFWVTIWATRLDGWTSSPPPA